MKEQGSSPRVRKALLADLSAILEIDSLSDPMSWTGDAYRAYLSDLPGTCGLVVSDQAGIWGFAVARRVGDELEILKIAVHPQRRGQGLASCLMEELEKTARSWEAPAWILEVRESNAAALALYRKFGLEITGRRPGYYADQGEDALLMTGVLPGSRLND